MKKSELVQLIQEAVRELNEAETYSPNIFQEALETIKDVFNTHVAKQSANAKEILSMWKEFIIENEETIPLAVNAVQQLISKL